MTLFEQIERQFNDDDNESHTVIFGRCSMRGTPGIFCKIRSEGGQRTLALGEGETCEQAMQVAMGKLGEKPRRLMPGMGV